jgi:hypothetical protein
VRSRSGGTAPTRRPRQDTDSTEKQGDATGREQERAQQALPSGAVDNVGLVDIAREIIELLLQVGAGVAGPL